MDTCRLLFAAEVHKLAQTLRNEAWQAKLRKHRDVHNNQNDDDTGADELKLNWSRENPIGNFVRDAFKIIRDVASQIDVLDSKY